MTCRWCRTNGLHKETEREKEREKERERESNRENERKRKGQENREKHRESVYDREEGETGREIFFVYVCVCTSPIISD